MTGISFSGAPPLKKNEQARNKVAAHYVPVTILTEPMRIHWKTWALAHARPVFKESKNMVPKRQTSQNIHPIPDNLTHTKLNRRHHPPPLYTHITFGCAAMQPAEVIQPEDRNKKPLWQRHLSIKKTTLTWANHWKGGGESLNQSLVDPLKLTLASGLAPSQVTEINAGRMIGLMNVWPWRKKQQKKTPHTVQPDYVFCTSTASSSR